MIYLIGMILYFLVIAQCRYHNKNTPMDKSLFRRHFLNHTFINNNDTESRCFWYENKIPENGSLFKLVYKGQQKIKFE